MKKLRSQLSVSPKKQAAVVFILLVTSNISLEGKKLSQLKRKKKYKNFITGQT